MLDVANVFRQHLLRTINRKQVLSRLPWRLGFAESGPGAIHRGGTIMARIKLNENASAMYQVGDTLYRMEAVTLDSKKDLDESGDLKLHARRKDALQEAYEWRTRMQFRHVKFFMRVLKVSEVDSCGNLIAARLLNVQRIVKLKRN